MYSKAIHFEFEPIKIANVTENGNVATEFTRFIALYEAKCLKELLGECLYKELMDSYEILEGATAYTLKDDASEPIKRLVNGYTYTAPDNNSSVFDFDWILFGGCGCGCGSSECNQRIWKGFVQSDTFFIGNAQTTVERTFINDYIYYHYLLMNRSVTAPTGQQVMAGENSVTVQNFSKRIDRWNEFIFSVIGREGETSLYRFLWDNKGDYPTWKPNCNLNFKLSTNAAN